MSETSDLASELERTFRGPAWHGPALLELLAEVDATRAVRRPVDGAHSIWEIVNHLVVWNEAPLRRLAGEAVVDLPPAQDWPPVPEASARHWEHAVTMLREAHRKLVCAVESLRDADLDRPVAGSAPTARGMLFGVLAHNLYHTGQIAMLAKAQAAGLPRS